MPDGSHNRNSDVRDFESNYMLYGCVTLNLFNDRAGCGRGGGNEDATLLSLW